MKADIHPDYQEITVTCSCGSVFTYAIYHEQTILILKFVHFVIRSIPVSRKLWIQQVELRNSARNIVSKYPSNYLNRHLYDFG
jgi:hypothetical protein